MNIDIQSNGNSAVIHLAGKWDSSLPEKERNRVLELARPGCALTLDFSRLSSITSIGLRMLLLLARHVHAVGGTVAVQDVPPELRDRMGAIVPWDSWDPDVDRWEFEPDEFAAPVAAK